MTVEPKFKAGQTVHSVQLAFSAIPPGRYQIVRLLPADQTGANQYRVKSVLDGHERVVRESQLSAT